MKITAVFEKQPWRHILFCTFSIINIYSLNKLLLNYFTWILKRDIFSYPVSYFNYHYVLNLTSIIFFKVTAIPSCVCFLVQNYAYIPTRDSYQHISRRSCDTREGKGASCPSLRKYLWYWQLSNPCRDTNTGADARDGSLFQ